MSSKLKYHRISDDGSSSTANISSSLSPPSSPVAKRLKMEFKPEQISIRTDDVELMDSADSSENRQAINVQGEEQLDHLDDKGEEALEPEPEDSCADLVQSTSSPVEPQLLPPIQYEYLDHTADVQIHAWGDNLSEAFEQCAMGMFAYITDIERVDNFGSETIQASGHDMLSLLYGFLDEWLFLFNAEPYFVARKISVTSFDRENFKISAIGYGETFNLAKHTQGTEVKAITYSNMQFHEKDNYAEVFVIIDI